MSARYSTSPTLRLRIVESSTARLVAFLFTAAVATGICHIAVSGYPWPALLLLCLQCTASARAQNAPGEGAVLAWRDGRWTLEHGANCRSLALQRAHCLPWITYLSWRDSNGRSGQLWLFADVGQRQQLRRLRVRLTLAR